MEVVLLANDLLAVAALLWLVAALLGLAGLDALGRACLGVGAAAGIAASLAGIPLGTESFVLPLSFAGSPVRFVMAPEALWLFGFGLAPALLAALNGTPAPQGHGGWVFGVAASLLGALGVFGLQQGAALLVAWELMSLGGAVMLLSERLSPSSGSPVLFMLGLLEVGAVALLLGVLLLAARSNGLDFLDFAQAAPLLPGALRFLVSALLLVGFGAKLGLLPFYEWFPGAYASGSGASGAVLSGVVLNAAYFGLSHAVLGWLPGSTGEASVGVGMLVVAAGTLSALLAVLYAFQAEDWRALLAFSSAENAGIAVIMLGAALLFRTESEGDLAGLAWTVALLHLAGHSLAKGGLFLAADGAARATGTYTIRHANLTHRTSWIFSIGALFCAMSLAAMPPQAGFVSEWFVFQTVFQGFHLTGLAPRLILALAGAGLALTAAVAFATFVKLFGIGVLGRGNHVRTTVPRPIVVSTFLLGLGVLVLAVGMPAWLPALNWATLAEFASPAAAAMHDGLLLVPLTAKFAFISPSMLVIAGPLLALIPLAALLLSRGFAARRAPVWYGGLAQDPLATVTTSLTFSNALRTFLSFIYRPVETTERETRARRYFVTRLEFSHDVAPVFGPLLFAPIERTVVFLAQKLRTLQSGNLNFYLALIGCLLVIILVLTLL
jgi:hydrogenase-4 component B